MKKSTFLAVFVMAFIFFGLQKVGWGQIVTTDDFNYADNSLLTANGWTAHSAGGTAPIAEVLQTA